MTTPHGCASRVPQYVHELQALMLDETADGAPHDDAQLELPLDPVPWARPVSLTVGRAARVAVSA